MKKKIKLTMLAYLIFWIIVLLLTSAKSEPISRTHFEISIALIFLPVYFEGLTILCDKIKKYLKYQ